MNCILVIRLIIYFIVQCLGDLFSKQTNGILLYLLTQNWVFGRFLKHKSLCPTAFRWKSFWRKLSFELALDKWTYSIHTVYIWYTYSVHIVYTYFLYIKSEVFFLSYSSFCYCLVKKKRRKFKKKFFVSHVMRLKVQCEFGNVHWKFIIKW